MNEFDPIEVEADPDTAFELGRVAGYDEAVRELTRPATDDEREALIALVNDARLRPGTGRTLPEVVADAILAAGFRRRGPITDEWEYGVEVTGSTGEPVVPGMTWTAPVASAEMFFPSFIRHVRRRKAGPWEPVSADG